MSLELDNLGRLYLNDPRIDFGYESWALKTYLSTLEEYLSFAHDQYRLRASRHLEKRATNLDPDEFSEQQRVIDDAAEKQIPRFFRMGALIPIWGLFESTVLDISRFVGQREKGAVSFSTDIHIAFCVRVKEYLEKLQVALPWTNDELARLGHLLRVRNLVVHNNGRLTGLNEDACKKKKEELTTLNLRFEDDDLAVSADYLNEVAALVTGVLTKLCISIAERYDDLHIHGSEI